MVGLFYVAQVVFSAEPVHSSAVLLCWDPSLLLQTGGALTNIYCWY